MDLMLTQAQANRIAAAMDKRDFQAELRSLAETPPARHVALEEIKRLMGPEPFKFWYDEVHKLRTAGKKQEYETAIFAKLDELKEQ